MLLHSKEMLLSGGRDKVFTLTVFFKDLYLSVFCPQKIGSAIVSTWMTYNYNNSITGYFYPKLLSVSGVLGTSGSTITADGSWNSQITANFKDEIIVNGLKFLRYSYIYTSIMGTFEGYVFLSPAQEVGDFIFSSAGGGTNTCEVVSLSDNSISYKIIIPSFNAETTLTYNATDQKIDYIYRA